MRIRRSTTALFAFIFFAGLYGLYMMMQVELNDADRETMSLLQPVESQIDQINSRVNKLEEEMTGNVEMMSNIKSKIEFLLSLENDQFDAKPETPPNQPKIPPVPQYGQCPAVIPYGKSNADHLMDNFIDKWDFVDVDGGVWKQGWPITTSDAEWKETKLKVILMPHSHNDPGWVKTIDVYYQGQTRTILNTIVDALSGHPARKFIWAEVVFLHMWFTDPQVTDDRKEKFKALLADGQIEIVTGGWVMTEEAPTHYFAMMDQLIEGHQWLKKNLNYHPKNGYNCDTFGATPTTAYLNQLAGIDHMLIQRTHYVVKKHFAQDKLLEFNWRQSFDNTGADDIFVHMMPFYSYDVPHTCGPEPAICCEFDFRRLRGQSPPIACPWNRAPQEITSKNVYERSRTLLDQYRKKAKLYAKGTEENTHVVLTLLGDDFRWDSMREADAQFGNYEKLFEYINNTPELNAEVKFGTLADYFALVEKGRPIEKAPSVTGDFFSYSDRVDNYWTGFFNSRPFYKWYDRYLEHWIQATDTAMSIAIMSGKFKSEEQKSKVFSLIQQASRIMDLFQHHDAITGTEKDFVVKDYADRLVKAVNMIHQAYAAVMNINSGEADINIDILTEKVSERGRLPVTKSIAITDECVTVDIFNSLLHVHEDIIKLKFHGAPYLSATFANGDRVEGQVSPWWAAETNDGNLEPNILSENTYELNLLVSVEGLSTRRVSLCGKHTNDDSTVPLSKVELHGGAADSHLATFKPEVNIDQNILLENQHIKLQINPKNGLLMSIKSNEKPEKSEISFAKYGTRSRGGSQDHSGAYLFMPDGPATELFGQKDSGPFRVIRGPLVNEVHLLNNLVLQRTSMYSGGISTDSINIENFIDLRGESNVELLMRVSTDIDNEKTLHTDLNGLSMSRKKYHDKLHIQGNVYPIVTAAFIEDQTNRINILSKQASGISSQNNGQIEIWLDRTLAQDDARGLGQPVVDNVLTKAEFKLLLETRKSDAPLKTPSIYLSTIANRLVEFMHSPLLPSVIQNKIDASGPTFSGLTIQDVPHDAKLVNLRPTRVNLDAHPTVVLILRRYGSDCSFASNHAIENNSGWPIHPKVLFGAGNVAETSLTLLDTLSENVSEINLEPMKIKTFTLG